MGFFEVNEFVQIPKLCRSVEREKIHSAVVVITDSAKFASLAGVLNLTELQFELSGDGGSLGLPPADVRD